MIGYEPGTPYDVTVGTQTFKAKTVSKRDDINNMKAYRAALAKASELDGDAQDEAANDAMVALVNTKLVTPTDTSLTLSGKGMTALWQALCEGGTVTDTDAKK